MMEKPTHPFKEKLFCPFPVFLGTASATNYFKNKNTETVNISLLG